MEPASSTYRCHWKGKCTPEVKIFDELEREERFTVYGFISQSYIPVLSST